MDASNITRTLAEGDLSAVIDALGVDERVDYSQDSLTPDAPARTVTLARLGVVEILVQPAMHHDGEMAAPGSLTAHTHPDEDTARLCFAEKSIELGEMVIRQNAAATAIKSDHRAQALLNMGMPPEMIMDALMEKQQRDAEATVDLSVTQARMDDGPSGFYL